MFLQFSHYVPSFTISHFSESSFLVNCKTEFVKAFQEVSSNSKCSVYLECSRLEEYVGNADGSRRLLLRAQQCGVEGIPALEAHTGSIDRAAVIDSATLAPAGYGLSISNWHIG